MACPLGRLYNREYVTLGVCLRPSTYSIDIPKPYTLNPCPPGFRDQGMHRLDSMQSVFASHF